MKTLSLSLVASATLLAAPTLCCAAPATPTSTKVQEQDTPTEKAEKKEPSATTRLALEKTNKQPSQKGLKNDANDEGDEDDDDDDDNDIGDKDNDKDEKHNSNSKLIKNNKDAKDENDDGDDEEFDEEEEFEAETMSAPYPFGELKLEEVKAPHSEASAGTATATNTPKGSPSTAAASISAKAEKTEAGTLKPEEADKTTAKSTLPKLWKAELPAKGFTIRSEWDEKPEFQNAARPDGKPQGAATLAMQQISDQEQQPFSLFVLMYIYDPETVGIVMTSPEKVIEQLITAPAEEAKQYGFVSTISDLSSTKPEDKRLMQELGVLQDIRKKVGIGQQDKTLYSQFYRVFIGKDFVVLGLVLGGEEGLEKKAQNFFDHISLVPTKVPATTPTTPTTPSTPQVPTSAATQTPAVTPASTPSTAKSDKDKNSTTAPTTQKPKNTQSYNP